MNSVFNAGATFCPTAPLFSFVAWKIAVGSLICAWRVRQNGVDGWQIDREPTFIPDVERFPEELWGVEDPRITYMPELQQYAVAYTSYSRGGPGVSLALTKDFRVFEKLGVVMSAGRQRRGLLPRRINGSWALIHRPMTPLGAQSGSLTLPICGIGAITSSCWRPPGGFGGMPTKLECHRRQLKRRAAG